MLAAADLGVTYWAVMDRLRKNPRLKAFKQRAEDCLLTLAEGVVVKSMEEFDGASARWFLDRKGKHLGYG